MGELFKVIAIHAPDWPRRRASHDDHLSRRDGRRRRRIDRLFETSFCDTFAHLYRPRTSTPSSRNFTPEPGQRSCAIPPIAVRIAEVDGAAVGYVKLGPLKLPVETDGRRDRCSTQLYVLKDASRRGHRTRADGLGASSEARRRGIEELYLTVFIDNHRARRFYERYGFEEVGRYDFMVGNHADEDIIMRKRL